MKSSLLERKNAVERLLKEAEETAQEAKKSGWLRLRRGCAKGRKRQWP